MYKVLEKLENVRKHRDIKLVTIKKMKVKMNKPI